MEIKNLTAHIGSCDVWAFAYEHNPHNTNASAHLTPTRVEIVDDGFDRRHGRGRQINVYKYLGGRGSLVKSNGWQIHYYTTEQEAREGYNAACEEIDRKFEVYITSLTERRAMIEKRRQEFGR